MPGINNKEMGLDKIEKANKAPEIKKYFNFRLLMKSIKKLNDSKRKKACGISDERP